MSDYGQDISRKGKNIDTCTDYQLASSSRYKTLPVALEGTTSLTSGANHVVINHNLGYVPLAIVSATSTDKNRTTLVPSGFYNLDIYSLFGDVTVTSTQLILDIVLMDETLTPTGSGVAKYYLLKNEL